MDSFGGIDSPLALLGPRCVDVYLNDRAYWSCIPVKVWEYTLGGCQAIKKWLSYREVDLLGRSLSPDEARHVTEVARRIASILLMSGDLDRSYEAVKASVSESARS